MEFTPFPKVSRLSREIVITEKIDGTNAQVYIVPEVLLGKELHAEILCSNSDNSLYMFAGSRTRWLGLGKQDNFGFAGWCKENAKELFKLGEGRHFGEWWGKGIQRGYGLNEKRFSLFNVHKWNETTKPDCCSVVPTLYVGKFDTNIIELELDLLRTDGSVAAPNYFPAEGIVIFHTASSTLFKKTIENDESPKSLI